MPSLEEFNEYLSKIWDSKVLTNNGPFHKELEERLVDFLGVDYLSLFNNGTSALLTALQSMELEGEVITTPYTFVATTHALVWNNLKPVFVDIDENTFNIDVDKIEKAITPHTSAILAVHCYGFPCDVERIEALAKKHNLKVIYDAAHAFDVKLASRSLLKYGDLSILSFHATKVFNTFEGGAVISPNNEDKKLIDKLKNFGIVDEVTIDEVGSNGKMSEINAAMGLLQLEKFNQENLSRKRAYECYLDLLSEVQGIRTFNIASNVESNYGYFPVLVEDSFGVSRDELYERLKSFNIFSRRYFYPLISNLPMYRNLESSASSNLPIANQIVSRVLCLPIFADLKLEEVSSIVEAIKSIGSKN